MPAGVHDCSATKKPKNTVLSCCLYWLHNVIYIYTARGHALEAGN